MMILTSMIYFMQVTFLHSTFSKDFSQFTCFDGTAIESSQICDGLPHCQDSSDEVSKLCRYVTCPTSMFRCSYGACIAAGGRCDGFVDCIDNSDEYYCDVADSGCDQQHFHCSVSNECIPLSKICNGYADCGDQSDETDTTCKNYVCPLHTYQCSYGGCVQLEVVCDQIKDCIDGTDEDPQMCSTVYCNKDDCPTFQCRKNEFLCENGIQCISEIEVCDGIHQCKDASDENPRTCITRECAQGYFRCNYGACILEHLKCNRNPDCHDWSDEDEKMCGIVLPENGCRLPAAKPGTHYAVSNCEECHPGDVVPELTKLEYSCSDNKTLEGWSVTYCQSSEWIPHVPRCFTNEQDIKCSPISTYGVNKRCEAMWGPHEGWISCNKDMPVGTLISLECLELYERERGSTHVTCLHDGTWNQLPLRCQPMCGFREETVEPLIVKGWEASNTEQLPWHATLFSHEDGSWNFFCGGTLISERVVLTAGHCVWKTPPEVIKVLLAAHSSNFTERNEETQERNVEKIELQSAYQDHDGNYGSDMALLLLTKPVLITADVLPACVDWSNTVDVSQRIGELGLVTGMGITENDTISKTLRVTTIKIIPEADCREKHVKDFRKYVTYTSFCAGWENGTSVCNGDSGGGLVLRKPNSTIWELHGVVSLSPRRLGSLFCDNTQYTIFTKVSIYGKWIKQILDSVPLISTPENENMTAIESHAYIP